MSGRQYRKGRLLLYVVYCMVHVLKICYFLRFVLYQMSKNMNRRIFFMFLVRLASVPEPAACNISSRDHVLKRANRMQVYLTGIISQQLITCWRSACNISPMNCLFQKKFRVIFAFSWKKMCMNHLPKETICENEKLFPHKSRMFAQKCSHSEYNFCSFVMDELHVL